MMLMKSSFGVHAIKLMRSGNYFIKFQASESLPADDFNLAKLSETKSGLVVSSGDNSMERTLPIQFPLSWKLEIS